MTLHISSVFTYDEDAGNYIQAVEGPAGDNQALEPTVRQAINNFVVGCKQDGIWDAIKASCILAGARTLAGALVPLAGTAPTNNGPFVAGDYNRKTGLVGDGSTKYLDSNRANDADPQNSKSIAIYASSLPTTTARPMLGLNRLNSEGAGASLIYNTLTRLHDSASSIYAASAGFIGASRSSSANYIRRSGNANATLAEASVTPRARNVVLFADNVQSSPVCSDARLAFYSIGEALDLAKLDGRVTDLINKFQEVIP